MPLGAEAAARLDRLVREPGPLLIGLSGGADSRALLMLAARWCRMSGRELHALVIDHGLRPESAGEARRAAAMAEAEGVPVRIERWPGPHPATGIQAAARTFRLTALAREARRLGVSKILLGHTASDRAETVLMRIAAGAGWTGLAAMPPASPHPAWPDGEGLWIARPLIDQSRDGIRAWLSAQGQHWIEDASNENRAFTRIRVRQALAAMAARGFDKTRLNSFADDAERANLGLASAAARLFFDTVQLRPWGGAVLDRSALSQAPVALRRRALAAAIAAVSGRPLPAPAAIEALEAALSAKEPATGGGAALTWWRGAAWLVREPGRKPPETLRLEPGERGWWDGRFAVEAGTRPVTISRLGRDYSGYETAGALESVPGLARATLTAAQTDGAKLAVTGLDELRDVRMTPLAGALAARSLFAGYPPAWFDRALAQREGVRGSRNLASHPPYPGGSDLEPVRT